MALQDHIEAVHLGPERCRKIAGFVGDYLAQRFSVTQLIEPVRGDFLSAVQLVADGMRPQKQLNEEQEKTIQRFQEALLQQSQILGEKYYGFFLKAAETNQDADWAIADGKFKELEREVQGKVHEGEFQTQLMQLVRAMQQELGKPDAEPEAIAAEFARVILVIVLPNLRLGVTKYYEVEQDLKKLHSLATLRAREVAGQ